MFYETIFQHVQQLEDALGTKKGFLKINELHARGGVGRVYIHLIQSTLYICVREKPNMEH